MDWSAIFDGGAAAVILALGITVARLSRARSSIGESIDARWRELGAEQAARIDKLHADVERAWAKADQANERAATAESRAASAEESARQAAATVGTTEARMHRIEQRLDTAADYIETLWQWINGGGVDKAPCPPSELHDVLDMTLAPRAALKQQ